MHYPMSAERKTSNCSIYKNEKSSKYGPTEHTKIYLFFCHIKN